MARNGLYTSINREVAVIPKAESRDNHEYK